MGNLPCRKLSVWDFGRDLPQVAAAVDRVPGLVRDTPLLRGKLLCVPSSGQQVTVFSVSDEPGSPPLKRVAGYQVPRGGQGAIYLAAGPEDELWMAGQSVRRLRLTRDSIVPDERAVALGIATQPLRVIDQDLIAVGYVGTDSRATAVIAAQRRPSDSRLTAPPSPSLRMVGSPNDRTSDPRSGSGRLTRSRMRAEWLGRQSARSW